MKRNVKLMYFCMLFVITVMMSGFSVYAQTIYKTVDSVAAEIRKEVVNRKTNIKVHFKISVPYQDDPIEAEKELRDDIKEKVFAYTGKGNEGEYLLSCMDQRRTEMDIYDFNFNDTKIFFGGYIAFTDIKYHDSAAKEKQVTTAVNNALKSLKLSNKTQYQKAKAIYEYVAGVAVYDTTEQKSQTIVHHDSYTAYGALIKKKAVCQGYASLLYRMCNQAGIKCRIISGTVGNEKHAWNAVYMNGAYYLCDATFDSENVRNNKKSQYFLRGSNYSSFAKRILNEEFRTAAFAKECPISKKDYNPKKVYKLTVNNGSGTATYTEGSKITVKANAPSSGKKFRKWTGTATFVNGTSANSQTAVIKITKNTTLTATYETIPVKYKLKVLGGTGSGTYEKGSVVTIKAHAPSTGLRFEKWVGSATYYSSTSKKQTAKIKITKDVTLTAKYEYAPVNIPAGSHTIHTGSVYLKTKNNASASGTRLTASSGKCVFKFEKCGTGYRIQYKTSGKYIKINGHTIVLSDKKSATVWIVVDAGNKNYRLVSGDKALTIVPTVNGQYDVMANKDLDSKSQKLRIS